MGRGKRTRGQIPLTAEVASSRLPQGLKQAFAQEGQASEKTVRAAERAAGRAASKQADLVAALEALVQQSDDQRSGRSFAYPPKSSRVMNGTLIPPPGMSDAKYRRQLTPLRQLGLVYNKNGAWWPDFDKAAAWLAEQAVDGQSSSS